MTGLVGGGSSSLIVGTTVITSGTTTRILYDNAGVVGEYTVTGTGTQAVLANTPTLITPVLGAATATSVAIGGATIGSNAEAVLGTVNIRTASDNQLTLDTTSGGQYASLYFKNNATTKAAIYWDNSNNNFHIGSNNSGGTIVLETGVGSQTASLSGSAFSPNTDGLIDLGTSAIGWKRIYQSGAISGAATTTTGSRFIQAAANVTDTSSSGTVATNYVNRLGIATLLASSSTTYTNNYGLWVEPATASTNVTITNNWAAGFNGGITAARQVWGTTFDINYNSTGALVLASASRLTWGDQTSVLNGATAITSGISQISAGVLGIGTGAAGSVAGTLQLTTLTASGVISSTFAGLGLKVGQGIEIGTADVNSYIKFTSRGYINGNSQADGIFTFTDIAGTSFGRLQFGGTTSSFPSIKRSSAALAFRLADDSADAAITAAGATFSGSTTFSAAAAGPILKQGANGRVGTFVANGVTPVTVSNTSVAISDFIGFSLNTAGGTVSVVEPTIATITAGTGFTVVAQVGDTSTYNYIIIKNAA